MCLLYGRYPRCLVQPRGVRLAPLAPRVALCKLNLPRRPCASARARGVGGEGRTPLAGSVHPDGDGSTNRSEMR